MKRRFVAWLLGGGGGGGGFRCSFGECRACVCCSLADRMQGSKPAVLRTVTAESQQHRISYEGRSHTSAAYRGGSAYVIRCWTCGLEPARPGHASNCMCMCKMCSKILRGHDTKARLCEKCSGVVALTTFPIGTVHVKAKGKRRRGGAAILPTATTTTGGVVVMLAATPSPPPTPFPPAGV